MKDSVKTELTKALADARSSSAYCHGKLDQLLKEDENIRIKAAHYDVIITDLMEALKEGQA